MRHEDTPEREELARLLPSPGNPVLSPDRQRVLEEHLMNEAQTPEPRQAPVRSRRRLALIGVPVAMAVAAGALVVGLRGGDDAPGDAPPVAREQPAPNAELEETIGQIVSAAHAAEPQVPEADQFIYTHSQVQFIQASEDGETNEPTAELSPLRSREIWLSPDGSQGWLIEPDAPGMEEEGVELGDEEGLGDSLSSPSYDFLSTLPTDPDALLELIYEDGLGEGDSPEERAFSTIGTLLRENLLPPGLSAGLYEAAGQIPGVMVVDDATDATGNEGIAVALESETYAERIEWVFDQETYAYLGERIVALEGNGAEPGTLLGWTGVVEQTIVDELRQRPGDATNETA
ncbi:CU044_5270 family protein [Streptomyces profundus]|uniref:CU044_5270 family protein n=1 Tax=Streptomyces profundus TaxID=2867410 RepID=UPI001D15E60A|nr:CU044_5270 family protein [Streptomyces sp. MA3_2.13]UED84703.1 CU044_5270 family protein [Streptomyces sp. MA3_2.13]